MGKFDLGDCVVMTQGAFSITSPGSWGYVVSPEYSGTSTRYVRVRFRAVSAGSHWYGRPDTLKDLGTEEAEFSIPVGCLSLYTPPPRSNPMREPKYKINDVVLSIDGPIENYDDDARNQLCIVREIDTYPDYEDTPEYVVYRCTTIATGEPLDLFESEIVEQADG